jgi:hypothetical protein
VQARSQQTPSGEHEVPATQPPAEVLQLCPRFALHAPLASQVPGQLSVSSAFLTAAHVPPGAGQVWQTPVQSLAEQQLVLAMHVPAPHGLNPAAQS